MGHRIARPDYIARKVFLLTLIYALVFATAVYFTALGGA